VRLDTQFVRLPLRFDAQRLAEDIATFGEGDWRPHPQGEPGNTALQLVARNGDPDDDGTAGAMGPTPHLARVPYVRQVLAALETVVGRTRLMRIDGGADLDLHADTNHYWWEHLRVHVPITTRPDVVFHCGGRQVHMAPGEAWVFDTWRPHGVDNPADAARIHLVVDTVGSPALWRLVEGGERPHDPAWEAQPAPAAERLVAFNPGIEPQLEFERVNRSPVMSPWEQQANAAALLDEARRVERNDAEPLAAVATLIDELHRDWRSLWASHGDARTAFDQYEDAIRRFEERVRPHAERLQLANTLDVFDGLRQLVIRPAVNRGLTAAAPQLSSPGPVRRGRRPRRIEQPIFVVSPPRSGSSLLFETLARSPTPYTIGGESHRVIESISKLNPAHNGWGSNRLTAEEADELVVSRLEAGFVALLRDRDGTPPPADGRVRLLEKTPKNALRVPFLAKAFPDAQFVYLYRDPRETLSSMLDAWRSGKFVTYPDLPGWSGLPWSLLLVPGWRELRDTDLATTVAQQWATTTEMLLDDLQALDGSRWCVAAYDRLISDPQAEITRICDFVGFEWDTELTAPLPNAQHTLSSPEPDKWQRNADEIRAMWPEVKATANRAHAVFAEPPATRPTRAARAEAVDDDTLPEFRGADAFASVYTSELPTILTKLASSLAVSTYQSGRLILVRMHDGKLNTHLRSFPSPMGVARNGQALVLGTKRMVWEFRNIPAVAAKVEPPGSHDAAFMPRAAHVTGDIRIHELVYIGGELWVANTRFSCLSTLDRDHSFIPRWRPPFVSALAAEDRCHLNGIAVRDGRIQFVTALGETDTPGGWRERKADGGIIVDVPSGEIVARGLSMPHSPRWHDGKLWVLESGKGEVNVIDVDTGRSTTVAQLPGFTRGLAFAGRYAFVGLSQVRESVFGGIPLAQRLPDDDRRCGIWVIDTSSGATVAFLRFEGAVQEIFDVQLLDGVRCPELVEPEAELVEGSFVVPDAALADVPR
jgi:uncharacterized protein (TIGR03032 family)